MGTSITDWNPAPLKFDTGKPVEASQPTEELLIVHVAAEPAQGAGHRSHCGTVQEARAVPL